MIKSTITTTFTDFLYNKITNTAFILINTWALIRIPPKTTGGMGAY